MSESQFPIVPINDNVVLKITSQISKLQIDSSKENTIISKVIVAIGDTVTKVKVGDNVITRNVMCQFIDVKSNDKTIRQVLADTTIISAGTLKKEAIEYGIISEFDIVAVDNQ